MPDQFRMTIAAASGGGHSSTRIPLTSELQVFADDPATREDRALFALTDRPIESRPINLLRAQVLKRAAKSGARLIGVTSAAPGAGKSFVTCNLAAAMSRIASLQVWLFDFDLRRPSVDRYFGVEVAKGMDAWLGGSIDDLGEIGCRFGESGLALYPTARCVDGAGEMIAGPRFAMLVEALRRLPDNAVVLFDLPPAFVSDDALTAIGKLDAYIHVMEEGVTPARQAQEVRNLMEPALCLGGVLNRYAGGWTDSYSYAAVRKYSQYYEKQD